MSASKTLASAKLGYTGERARMGQGWKNPAKVCPPLTLICGLPQAFTEYLVPLAEGRRLPGGPRRDELRRLDVHSKPSHYRSLSCILIQFILSP